MKNLSEAKQILLGRRIRALRNMKIKLGKFEIPPALEIKIRGWITAGSPGKSIILEKGTGAKINCRANGLNGKDVSRKESSIIFALAFMLLELYFLATSLGSSA